MNNRYNVRMVKNEINTSNFLADLHCQMINLIVVLVW